MKTPIEEFSKNLQVKSDKLMNYFLATFFIIGLLLAGYYDTWLIATGVGGLSLLAYYSAKWILPGSDLYQYVLSAVVGIFMAQFIYQVHGMFEMHFFAFIGSTILITYRNWKLQIPLAIVVILHHTVFGYLQFAGFNNVYFTQLEYMNLQIFIIHTILTVTIFFLCGLWSYNFKRSDEKHIARSFDMGKLQEALGQREVLVAMSEDLQQANKRLKEVNSELEKIFNTVEEVLFSVDFINFRVIEMSVACKKVYGYSPIEFIADNELWKKVIHPDDKYIVFEVDKKLNEGKTVCNRYRIIHKDKRIRWIEAKVIPTIDKSGRLIRIDGIHTDITGRIELEQKLAQEKKQKQQQLTAAAITAQENERSFLGKELHDNINPILATAKLYIDCAISDEEKRTDLLKDSKGFINTAMNEIRTLCKSLVPPSLGEIGLVDAIMDMLSNIKKVNDLEFVIDFKYFDETNLSDSLKLTIYRILQEQLNNVLKHAEAKTVFIRLVQEDTKLEMVVKDDGIGFNTMEKRTGVGIQNIISRTELCNGKVIINSQPGKGCVLMINFDMSQESFLMKRA